MRLKTFLLSVLLLSGVFWQPTAVQSAENCPDALPSRLTIGAQGRVTPGDANNVRAEPTTDGALVGQIPGGGVFDVLDGVVCANGFAWWYVRYGALEGWTVEGADDYWLEPYTPASLTLPDPSTLVVDNGLVKFGTARFMLDPALASGVDVAILDARIPDPNVDMPQPATPQGMYFTFSDPSGAALPFTLTIYPTAGFKQIDPAVEITHDALDAMALVGEGSNIPMLFKTRGWYLHFNGGGGWRILTQYAFDVRPITNPLDYVFSGVSEDGQYYIVGQGQVVAPGLPASFDFAAIDDEFNANFESYVADLTVLLTDAARVTPEQFTPSLDLLDGLIESVWIGSDLPTVTLDGGTTRVSYENISLAFDSQLGTDVLVEHNAESLTSMSPTPAYTCLMITDNTGLNEFWGDRVCIFPTAFSTGEAFMTDSLGALLEAKPAFATHSSQDYIPRPFSGAAQMMRAQVKYLDFGGGKGVRYITYYAQMESPPTSRSISYEFSGLTADGRYYVWATLGVSTALLPKYTPADFDMLAFANNMTARIDETVQKLNAAPNSDFSPNLDILDTLIRSITFAS